MATDDFFRARPDSMIDMRHPLVVLSTRIPWAEIVASLAPVLAHKIAVADSIAWRRLSIRFSWSVRALYLPRWMICTPGLSASTPR